MVEVDQSLFAFLLKIFFYRNNAVHLFYDRDGFETRLGEFWWKSFPWIAHLTQETTWKSSNWLWRQSPTSLATGSKSTSSLNLQTNFTVSHICVGSLWSLIDQLRLCIYNVRINCYDYHVLLRPWLAGDSLTFPDFHLWVISPCSSTTIIVSDQN